MYQELAEIDSRDNMWMDSNWKTLVT